MTWTRGWLGLACLLGVGGASEPAYACGGFFCSSAPIDQAGETVVYSFEPDGDLTMSVRIEYEGQDEDFAWILPVPVPPELSLASDALFDVLERETQPQFSLTRRIEGQCRPRPTCVDPGSCGYVYDTGCGGGIPSGGSVDRIMEPDEPDAGGPIGGPGVLDPPAGEVTVFSQGTVGPYDTVVLGAATAAEVIDWLQENNYDIPTDSGPLLELYAAQNYVFVALRLSAKRTSGELQPITMRMDTDEACLPIRLTAIAAVSDMPIRAFFLGDGPVHSTNFNHAEVDTGALDLYTSRGGTYFNRVANAVDELGGHAFVTDYAGPMPDFDLVVPSVLWLADETDPATLVKALAAAGYAGDGELLDIFTRFLEPPVPVESPTAYYNCLAMRTTVECGVPTRFDPVGLVQAVEDEITVPRREAQERLMAYPYLTRLFTTLSPSEMTVDPVFEPDEGLPEQPFLHAGEYVEECSSNHYLGRAPTRFDIAGRSYPGIEGELANDRAYCSALGAVPIDEAPSCPEPSSGSSGCALYPSLRAPMTATVPMLALGLFLLRRVRRRR